MSKYGLIVGCSVEDVFDDLSSALAAGERWSKDASEWTSPTAGVYGVVRECTVEVFDRNVATFLPDYGESEAANAAINAALMLLANGATGIGVMLRIETHWRILYTEVHGTFENGPRKAREAREAKKKA